MGWLLCIVLLVGYCFTGTDIHLIASCLFAIAGAIDNVATATRKPRIHIG